VIAVSWVLVIVAAAALVLGIYQGGLVLIFVAIAGAVISAIALALGLLEDRAEEPSASEGADGPETPPEEPAGGSIHPVPRRPKA
jgi:hypothetical protein